MQKTTNVLKPFSVVVAVSKNNGIGLKGTLPWPHLQKDMKNFAQITSSKEPMSYSLGEMASKLCFF